MRWVSDFRYVNRFVVRKVWPLPIIHDVLHRRSGYIYFTKLDIAMQYYTFVVALACRHLFTINTPFGLYHYKRLPMGLCNSPDIAQEYMENLFHDMPDVEVYIDDIGIFSNDWESHVATINEVCRRLQEKNFVINPLKCEWAVQETDWLGY